MDAQNGGVVIRKTMKNIDFDQVREKDNDFCDLGLKNVRFVRYFGLATTILQKISKTDLSPQRLPERVAS